MRVNIYLLILKSKFLFVFSFSLFQVVSSARGNALRCITITKEVE